MALGAAVLTGCAAPAAVAPSGGGLPLRISDPVVPLSFFDGARAKELANAQCGPRGVRSSINDRYENGTWVFVEGCA
jgi:hypothetical protein